MTDPHHTTRPWLNGWRIAGWGSAVALLVAHLIAMQFTDEVVWTPLDFAFAAILLLVLGTGLELAMRVGAGPKRFGIAIAALAAFVTVWANAAVGFIGNENEPVNTGFNLLVLAGVVSGIAARFRARWMRWIVAGIALGQPALGLVALWMMPGHAVEWGILVVFAAIWGASALCFHAACHQEAGLSAR